MKLNNKDFYVMTYPYGNEKLGMDEICEVFQQVSNHIREKDPEAEIIALPDKLTIQQMSLHDIVGIRNYLDDIILHYWTEEEEE